MNSIKSRQSGFTLVEIAIVLVIIGVLLAGVLKGQALINNSRIKGLVNNMNAVSSAYNGYIDRYAAVPGTEALPTLAARGWTTNTVGGVAPLNLANLPHATTFATAGDQTAFWQSLGAAGFFATTPNTITNPTSANGGIIGVTFTPFGAAAGISGVSVCLSTVTGQQAEGVDVIIDGPLPVSNIGANVGSLQGVVNAAAPFNPAGANSAVAYNENSANFWTVCRSL